LASRFYGVNVGAMQPKDVTEGAATGSTAVELQVDLTKTTDKLQVIQAVTAILSYLETVESNPIG
jgi:hypothetical protein